MENKEKQSKVMQLIVKHSGVSSVEVKGDDKVEVVGNGIDAVALATDLRKRMRRYANIDTVKTVDEKEEKKKKEEDTWPKIVTTYPLPLYINEPRQSSDCCLM